MNLCVKVGGFDNPALASWGVGLGFHAVASVLLIALGLTSGLGEDPNLDAENYTVTSFVSGKVFLYSGLGLALLFVTLFAIIIAGYLVCSNLLCFVCPFACLSQLFGFVICGFSGYLLNALYYYNESVFKYLRDPRGQFPEPDYTIEFIEDYQNMILAIALLLLCVNIPYSHAAAIDEDGIMVDVFMYIPSLITMCSIGGLFTLLFRDSEYIVLGAVALVLTFVTTAVINFKRLVVPRLFTLVTMLCMALCAAFGFIAVILCTLYYIAGRNQYLNLMNNPPSSLKNFVQELTHEDFLAFKNYKTTKYGGYNIAGMCFGSILFSMCLYSVIYLLRSIVAPKRTIVRDKRDNA